MQSQLEPLLTGLYKIGQCFVLLLDGRGNTLRKYVPHGHIDLQEKSPRALKHYVQQITSVNVPVLLSTTQQVGGLALPDDTILVVGPLTPKILPRRATSTAGDKENESAQVAAALAADTTTANAAGAGAANSDAAADSDATLQWRREAVNVQLESLAWLAQRALGQDVHDLKSRRELQKGSTIEAEVLAQLSEVKDILPDWREVVPENRPHSSYVFEFNDLDAIRRGDPNLFALTRSIRHNGQNGILGYTPLRSAQNQGICAVVLNSRAALAGGLSAEHVYTIADFMILSLERCKTVEQADLIGYKSGLLFAYLVQKAKQQYPKKILRPLSTQALEVVRRYLYTKVDRKQIARDLKVNVDYLDRVLKADCDVTIMGCLRFERVEEAKRLLVQSAMPIYEVASLLLFSNSSHFSRVFKELTGMTPQAYRQQQQTTFTTLFM